MRQSRTFEPRADEVLAARHFVTSALRLWEVDCEAAALLVSELATNAVLHARSEFEVTVIARDDKVRVEVSDDNSRLPSITVVPADAYSGRGLMIVQALSEAWGVETDLTRGKTIWFEMARRGSLDGMEESAIRE